MLKHNREEWDDILQKVMNMMEDDYPNNYELVVNSFSAEIRSNLTVMCFAREDILKQSEPVSVNDSKLRDEVIEEILRCEDLDWNEIDDVRTVAIRLEGMYMDLEENFNNKCSYCEDRYKLLLERKSKITKPSNN